MPKGPRRADEGNNAGRGKMSYLFGFGLRLWRLENMSSLKAAENTNHMSFQRNDVA